MGKRPTVVYIDESRPVVLAEFRIEDLNLTLAEYLQIVIGIDEMEPAQRESTYLTLVRKLGSGIESRDTYTFGHSERVAGYAALVATALNFGEEQRTTIRVGAYLHDLGKVRVPDAILSKPGKLTVEEFGIIKKHPEWGVELLAQIDFPWDIKPIIMWHHEKNDGSGYPVGLQGDDIPLNAQIIGIVDVYDALTTTRSYRPAMTHDEAITEMRNCRHWWKPEVYAAFVHAVDRAAAALAQDKNNSMPELTLPMQTELNPMSLLTLIHDRVFTGSVEHEHIQA